MSDFLRTSDYQTTIDEYAEIEVTTVEGLQASIPPFRRLQECLRARGRHFQKANTVSNATSLILSVTTVALIICIPFTFGATAIPAAVTGGVAFGSGLTSVGINIAGNVDDSRVLADDIQDAFTQPINVLSRYQELVGERRNGEFIRLSEMSTSRSGLVGAFLHGVGGMARIGGVAARGVVNTATRVIPRIGAAVAGVGLGAVVDAIFLGINIRDLVTGDTSSKANDLEKIIAEIENVIVWIREDVRRRREICLIESFTGSLEVEMELEWSDAESEVSDF